MLDGLKTGSRVVGIKQTHKAVLSDTARTVFVARDAERRVLAPLMDACERSGVPLSWVETMAELGAACGIDVGAACAATLKP